MESDYILLSRMIFSMTASFHIIFPCMIIGLALYLAVLELLWLRTRKEIYKQQYEFWIKPFAIAFIIGFITGLILSYQLDTTFNELYRQTIDILVPIRKVEMINVLLLEAGVFIIMVWGWGKVGNHLHFLATVMMAIGLVVSLTCILTRNSWMQTPDGYALIDNQLAVTEWLSVIFNPSFPYRFFHMLDAAILSTALFITGISARYLLRRRNIEFARFNLRVGVTIIAISALLQIIIGDLHGLNTKQHQPIKVAAIEALWETRQGAPLVVFAIPDSVSEQNKYSIEIPNVASMILTHSIDGKVVGLKSTPPQYRPNVTVVFVSFRIMVALGLLILGVGIIGLVLLSVNRIYEKRWYLMICYTMTPFGFLATIAGWCVTEAGRQPWVINGLLTTSDVINKTSNLHNPSSLMAVGIIYLVLLTVFIISIHRLLTVGPSQKLIANPPQPTLETELGGR